MSVKPFTQKFWIARGKTLHRNLNKTLYSEILDSKRENPPYASQHTLHSENLDSKRENPPYRPQHTT
jgi:hypothetical protein